MVGIFVGGASVFGWRGDSSLRVAGGKHFTPLVLGCFCYLCFCVLWQLILRRVRLGVYCVIGSVRSLGRLPRCHIVVVRPQDTTIILMFTRDLRQRGLFQDNFGLVGGVIKGKVHLGCGRLATIYV